MQAGPYPGRHPPLRMATLPEPLARCSTFCLAGILFYQSVHVCGAGKCQAARVCVAIMSVPCRGYMKGQNSVSLMKCIAAIEAQHHHQPCACHFQFCVSQLPPLLHNSIVTFEEPAVYMHGQATFELRRDIEWKQYIASASRSPNIPILYRARVEVGGSVCETSVPCTTLECTASLPRDLLTVAGIPG